MFFGVWAMVAAARGDLAWAGWFIIIAGVLDMLDGRIARFTRTGSEFGEQLDSLVDAVSFGVAPALIMYHQFYADAQWSWLLSYIYTSAVILRLARFNVEQTGGARRHFLGLPSTTAGMTLAAFYPFSQTSFFQTYLGTLPWAQIMGAGMLLLGVLMLSHIPYAKFPRVSFSTPQGIFNSVIVIGGTILAVTVPHYYFFPATVWYILYGLGKSVFFGLQERVPDEDPLMDEDPDDPMRDRPMDYDELAPHRFRRTGTHSDASEDSP
jgi:CDP-diacylglycerol--serine O-phosphatidyltransferase